MSYWHQTLSFTTVDSWKTGVICEVITPQRQDLVWPSPLAMLLLLLRTAGFSSLKIESGISISVQNWGYMWGHHTQRQCEDWQSTLAKFLFDKKTKQTKTGVTCEVVTPKRQYHIWSSPFGQVLWSQVQNWSYLWGCHNQRHSLNWQSPLAYKQ